MCIYSIQIHILADDSMTCSKSMFLIVRERCRFFFFFNTFIIVESEKATHGYFYQTVYSTSLVVKHD